MVKRKTRVGLVSLKSGDGCVPMGLVYLGTYLKNNGVDVTIIDSNFSDPLQVVVKGRFDMIGISAMTVHYGRAVKLATQIKAKRNLPIIIGGVHISTLPVLEKCFDTAITGEGEKVFLQMAKYGLTKGIVKGEPIQNLDDLPQLDWSLVDKRYFAYGPDSTFGEFGISGNILTSRGCPYRCRFCSTTKFWDKLRFHSANYVIEAIDNLIKNQNANLIQIWDDLFTINIPRLIEIKDKLKLPKNVKFNCQPRPNLVTDRLCKVLKEMHVTTGIFGFESGSDKVLGYLKRNTVTVEDNKKAILMFKKHKIGVQGSVVFGSPNETLQDMAKTLDFIDFCYKNDVERLWAFVLTPFPGTELWDDKFKEWDKLVMQNNPLLLDPNINIKDFQKIYSLALLKIKRFRFNKVKMFIHNSPWESFKYLIKSPRLIINLLTRSEDV
jgi:radical SAM superfamily enzyme YgiQ (UPF0313 family)